MGFLLWLSMVVLWLTWAPYSLREEPSSLQWSLALAPSAVVGNLLLFAPLAAVVALLARGRPWHRLLLAIGAAAVGSLIVEAGQWRIEGRHVSPWDFLLNTAGAAMAAFVVVRLPLRVRRGVCFGIGSFIFTVLFLYLSISAYWMSEGQRLEAWDPSYTMLMGKELGGERTYQGSVRFAELCAGTNASAVCAGPGADPDLRGRLVEAAEKSQNLRVRAIVTSQSGTQEGPTRILTFSEDTKSRNITLGQEGRDLILRVRTAVSGPNGTRGSVALEDAIPVGEETRLEATYQRGVVRLTAEARGQRRSGVYYPGLLQAWLVAGTVFEEMDTSYAIRPVQRWSAAQRQSSVPLRFGRWLTALAAVLVIFPISWTFGYFQARRPGFAVALASLLPPALLWLLDASFALPPTPEHVLSAFLVSVAGGLLGVRDGSFRAARLRLSGPEGLEMHGFSSRAGTG